MVHITPKTDAELLARAEQLSGLSLQHLAHQYQRILPSNITKNKGWLGQFFEEILGASAGTMPLPDFHELGIELKTIPVDSQLKPLESTYVCHINLANLTNITWDTSLVRLKLSKVLWVPIISEEKELSNRIVATPFLWELKAQDLSIIKNDWVELTDLMSQGQLEEVSGKYGQYLQVRPKAANKVARSSGVGETGEIVSTLPRGFYLRASFTRKILHDNLLI